MRTKIRNLSILAAVLLMSVVALSAVSAQDTTATAEPSAPTERPFLGVSLQDSDNGVTVADVVSGSAAADAGIAAGDIITAINGADVATVEEAKTAIAGLSVGDEVTVDLMRGDEAMTLTATLGAQAPMMANPILPGRGNNNRGNRGNGGMLLGRELGLSYDNANHTWTITRLSEDSQLYADGLREGDVITAVDGESVDLTSLFQHMQSLSADSTVTLTIDRDGESQDIDVNVSDLTALVGFGGMGFNFGEMPRNFSQMMPMFNYGFGNGRLGVTFQTIDAQVAEANNLSVTEGALITEVAEGSPAADAGLQANDVVTAVNNEAVDEEHTLRDRLVAYEASDTITLTVLRDSESQDIEVTLGEPLMSDLGDMFQNGFRFHGQNGEMFPFHNMPDMMPTPEVVPNT